MACTVTRSATVLMVQGAIQLLASVYVRMASWEITVTKVRQKEKNELLVDNCNKWERKQYIVKERLSKV